LIIDPKWDIESEEDLEETSGNAVPNSEAMKRRRRNGRGGQKRRPRENPSASKYFDTPMDTKESDPPAQKSDFENAGDDGFVTPVMKQEIWKGGDSSACGSSRISHSASSAPSFETDLTILRGLARRKALMIEVQKVVRPMSLSRAILAKEVAPLRVGDRFVLTLPEPEVNSSPLLPTSHVEKQKSDSCPQLLLSSSISGPPQTHSLVPNPLQFPCSTPGVRFDEDRHKKGLHAWRGNIRGYGKKYFQTKDEASIAVEGWRKERAEKRDEQASSKKRKNAVEKTSIFSGVRWARGWWIGILNAKVNGRRKQIQAKVKHRTDESLVAKSLNQLCRLHGRQPMNSAKLFEIYEQQKKQSSAS